MCKHIFCTNFHYSSIPDTSNAQIAQSETPQTPSPILIFQPLLHMHHLLRKYQPIQKQSSYTYIILLTHNHTILRKVFNGFLMAGNWKKQEKDVSFDEIFIGKIRSITKNSWKKERGNVDLRGKVSTFKSKLNHAFSRLILTWVIFCSFCGSRVYLRNKIGEIYQKIFYQQN